MKRVICLAATLAVLLGTTNAFAQTQTDQQSDTDVSAVIKMNGISPLVGAEFAFDSQNMLRTLGFFSVNSSRARDSFLLDLSYLRTTDWLGSDTTTIYWGVNMNLEFDDTVIGPGALVGASYNLDDRIAVYGEAGLNMFFYDNGNNVTFGMLNSGVGLKLRL